MLSNHHQQQDQLQHRSLGSSIFPVSQSLLSSFKEIGLCGPFNFNSSSSGIFTEGWSYVKLSYHKIGIFITNQGLIYIIQW